MEEPLVTLIHFSAPHAPQITVCPVTPYNDKVLSKYGITHSQYVNGMVWWGNSSKTITPEEIYNSSVWSKDELIQKVILHYDGGTNQEITNKSTNWKFFWTEKRDIAYGNCYSFQSKNKFAVMEELKSIKFNSDFNNTLDIYIHNKNQFSNDFYRSKWRVTPNTRNRFRLSIDQTNIINKKNAPCLENEFSYDMEKTKVITHLMMKEVGCVVPYIMRNEKYTKICRNSSLSIDAARRYVSRKLADKMESMRPCSFMKIGAVRTMAESDKNTKILFIMPTHKKIIEQKISYTGINYFAEVGGFLGLLLGYSIFQISDLIELIWNKLRPKIRKRTICVNHSNNRNVSAGKTVLNNKT